MDNIINFTALKIVRDRKRICQCARVSYTVDTQNRLVTCSQCGAYVDPFDALACIAGRPEILQQQIDYLKQMHQELLNYKPRMVIFKNLAQNYRKSKHGQMLPCCPVCGDGFRFEEIRSWIHEDVCMRLKRKEGQQ